jgi:hypothetical protein
MRHAVKQRGNRTPTGAPTKGFLVDHIQTFIYHPAHHHSFGNPILRVKG